MSYRIVMQPRGVLHAHCQAASDDDVDRIADEVRTDARRFCPVDSGDLRGTIRKEKNGLGSRLIIAGDEAEGVDYAVYQELGTSKMSAQPYLRPALYRVRS